MRGREYLHSGTSPHHNTNPGPHRNNTKRRNNTMIGVNENNHPGGADAPHSEIRSITVATAVGLVELSKILAIALSKPEFNGVFGDTTDHSGLAMLVHGEVLKHSLVKKDLDSPVPVTFVLTYGERGPCEKIIDLCDQILPDLSDRLLNGVE